MISILFALQLLWHEFSTPNTNNPPVAEAPAEPEQKGYPPQQPQYDVESIVNNLAVPWDVAFVDDQTILVTERPGTLRVIKNGNMLDQPLHSFANISTEPGAESGLMSIALDPDYPQNNFLYFSVVVGNPDDSKLQILRFTNTDNGLTEKTILLDNVPAAKYHDGSRIAFGPDGKLYITTGDALLTEQVQDVQSLVGKTLRINANGSIPQDNPFEDSPVWSYGHRNAQGIAWAPNGNQLQTEHGPSGFDGPPGGDEVNLIIKGGNYGWPLVSHQDSIAKATDPLAVYTPANAPASAAFYNGDKYPALNNCLLFGGLRGEGVYCARVPAPNYDRVTETFRVNTPNHGRIRTVTISPVGDIYYTTSNQDNRGDSYPNADHLYRLIPPQ
jgi:glucose/arabinose dehydrogenase